MGFFSKSYGISVDWNSSEVDDQIGESPSLKYDISFNSESELKEHMSERFSKMKCKHCNSIQVQGAIKLKVVEVNLFCEEVKSGFFGDKVVKVKNKTLYTTKESKGVKAKCSNCKISYDSHAGNWGNVSEEMKHHMHYMSVLLEYFVPA